MTKRGSMFGGSTGVSIVLSLLLLNGCVGVNRPSVEKREFMLTLERAPEASHSGENRLLRILTVKVSPEYEGKGLVYRHGDSEYHSDFYNGFFVPPGAMFTEALRRWFAPSGLFELVTDYADQREPDYTLQCVVRDFYGDRRRRGQSQAILTLEFVLYRNADTRPQLVFHKTYNTATPVAPGSADALVKGWEKGLSEILATLETDVEEAISRNTQAPPASSP